MINRRNIRVKVVQVIYSFDCAGIKPNSTEICKALKEKFEETGSLLNFLTTLTTEVAKYVEVYSNQKASKHLPTKADLNINTKLAGNEIIWQLMENKSFAQACRNTKTENRIDKEIVKKLFLKLEASETYQQYIQNENRSQEEDKNIMKYIFNELILGDEQLLLGIAEQFQNFDDDIEMLQTIINQTFEKPKSTLFTKLITNDKETFANNLVNTYYEKLELFFDFIAPKLKNWDPERVAKLDMLIIKLGISELLFFETIPVKVTINEYIDIAKDYSTAQSGQFVNGILDSIHKDLLQENKLNKVDFRRI